MRRAGVVLVTAATLAAVAAPRAAAAPSEAPGAGDGAPDQPDDADDGAGEGESAGGAPRCPTDMVEVEGDYCPTVEQRCRRWMPPEPHAPPRCAVFAPTEPCAVRTVSKHFCIDTFEFPNQRGQKPVVMKTYREAESACTAKGKRLCGDTEWTLACEGQERLPYPYGTKRDFTACNIDKPRLPVDQKKIRNPRTRSAEIRRLWQGEESGAREGCESPYGVFDMTGNVDEWVKNEKGVPHKSGLKGGYWGPVRNRCRPMTTAHSEGFAFYQTGFRCCSDLAP
jgi:formylglycine-generating enzyme